ncbi:hypothetical protein ACR30L_14910 [Psychromonas sp. PT13]|uniref:hypothetical protein n=1 Tax=Psychromonas sp. PT13 TaxID=3439547 RepID=UPI003EBEC952
MATFWFLGGIYVVLLWFGTMSILSNVVQPLISQVVFFALAACLSVFMRGWGHNMNIVVLVLLTLALIGIFVGTLQVLGIITIGPTSALPFANFPPKH